MRADRSRYLSDKITELFTESLKAPRVEEYKGWNKVKKSTKDEEIYDSIGSFSKAKEKIEGGDFHYEPIKQMFQTTIINKTYDQGFYETMEAVEDDVEKVIGKINMGGLMRAMVVNREVEAAKIVDGVFTTVSADGQAYASAAHPLDTSKTAEVNDNLLASTAITPSNMITACNKFHAIKDYAGNLFSGTYATAFLAHANHESTFNAIQQSNLKAQELSNTKNTVPKLKGIFGRFINAYYWHLLDENIDSFVDQQRRGLQELEEQDRIKTGNYYWNMNERRRFGQINPGYGHVSCPWNGTDA